MFKKTDRQGCNSQRGESYYVPSLRDVRTQLASFFGILCDRRLQSGTVQGDNAGIAAQDTKHRGVAQPGSVLAWGASGRPFKSARPDQFLSC